MTYLQFHLLFVVPPLLALALARWLRRRAAPSGPTPRGLAPAILAMIVVALIYTTPWDNLLVARGVWDYPPGRVAFTLGYVPIEEYLFFVLQTALTGLWLAALWPRFGTGSAPPAADGGRSTRILGGVAFALIAVAGALALTRPHGLYLGLVLVWAAPVLALQWSFGGDLLMSRWRLLLGTVVPPTLYLGAADRFAIHDGIWSIAARSTTGVQLAGLPLEEGLFFLVTNLMIAFGLMLVLDERSPARLRVWRARVVRGRARPSAPRVHRDAARPGRRGWRLVLVLWAVSMIPIPLLGEAAFLPLAYLSTALLALGATGMAVERAGVRALAAAAVALVFGWAVELLGSRTGIPFGAYSYLAAGPEILGVPVLVPLGWWAFTALGVGVAWRRLGWAGVAGALVAWDAGLDPLMVSRGLWRFEPAGAYFGVPLANFVGWALAGAVLAVVVVRIAPGLGSARIPEAGNVYLAQALLIATGLVLFGMPGAGLVAGLAMLVVVVAAAGPRALRRLASRALVGTIGVAIPSLILRSLRRDLAGVWGRAEAPVPSGGIVVAANHHAWWDGYLAFMVARRWGRPLTVLMDERQLARFPFFRAHGAIGAHEVRTALRRLEQGHLVVVFAEAGLRAPGPLGSLAPGAAYLARRSRRPVLPLALRVTMRGSQRPEAFVRPGAALDSDSCELERALEDSLAALVERLDADLRDADPEAAPLGYQRWLEGRASTHRRFGWGARLWGRQA